MFTSWPSSLLRSGKQGAYNKVQTNQLLSAVLVQWIFKHLVIKPNIYAGQFLNRMGTVWEQMPWCCLVERGWEGSTEDAYMAPPSRLNISQLFLPPSPPFPLLQWSGIVINFCCHFFSLIEWRPEDHEEETPGWFSVKRTPLWIVWRWCSWKLALCVWWMAHWFVSFWAVCARFFNLFLNINELKAFRGKEFKSLNHFPLLHSGGHMYGGSFNVDSGVGGVASNTRLYWRW